MTKKIDTDVKALRQARNALMKSSSPRMLKANLDYLRDYFIDHPADEVVKEFVPKIKRAKASDR